MEIKSTSDGQLCNVELFDIATEGNIEQKRIHGVHAKLILYLERECPCKQNANAVDFSRRMKDANIHITEHEYLQILNNCPKSQVELYTVILWLIFYVRV